MRQFTFECSRKIKHQQTKNGYFTNTARVIIAKRDSCKIKIRLNGRRTLASQKNADCSLSSFRQNLALNEGVAGHITARDPERLDHFWVNGFGVDFGSMKVSQI